MSSWRGISLYKDSVHSLGSAALQAGFGEADHVYVKTSKERCPPPPPTLTW